MRLARLAPVLLALACASASAEPRSGVAWEPWSTGAFERARTERRLVLLSVSAGWCHWCHVMDRTTYGDPRVSSFVASRLVPVRVDADARPDLAERFAEYHWPATAFLTPDGRTVAALRGWRGPEDFLEAARRALDAHGAGRTLLEADLPVPRTVAGEGEAFLPALRDRLAAVLDRTWDEREGGWGRGQKYPHPAALEHALHRAALGDGAAAARAAVATERYRRLLDPVWGGLYQYSEGGTWGRPHFEKVMAVNAGGLANFARAHRRTRERAPLEAAQAVRRWLLGFLATESGAFRTSQDADLRTPEGAPLLDGPAYFARDDAGRRRAGIPRVDPAVYAQENGWAIRALVELHRATLAPEPLAEAERAADAVLAAHATPEGGFRHAAGDRDALHVGDTVAMGHALLAIHQASGDPRRLEAARRAASFLCDAFLDPRGGFLATAGPGGAVPAATTPFSDGLRPFQPNASAARFLLALHAVTGEPRWRREAVRALAAVSDPGLAERFGPRVAECLLAAEEATLPWVRVVVVGEPGDARETALWRAAVGLDAPMVALVRGRPGDPSSGGLPAVSGAAAFACASGACSPPVREPAALASAVRAVRRRRSRPRGRPPRRAA